MLKETMYWIQLGMLSAFLGGMLGSPTKALADMTLGKPTIYNRLPACECSVGTGCFCN